MKSEEKEFYRELDKDKSRTKEKTLSFWTLGALVLAVIFVGELALFWFGRGIRSAPRIDFSVRGQSGLAPEISSTTEQDGISQTIISQGAMCSKLTSSLKGEITCAISKEGIIISGKISPLLPKNASVYITPKVQDKKVKFEITKVTIGKIAFARMVATPISSAISSAVNSSLPADSQVTSIDLKNAFMVIVTSKKLS